LVRPGGRPFCDENLSFRIPAIFSGVINFFPGEKSCDRSSRSVFRRYQFFLGRKLELRNFPPFFLALSTFSPARNRAAEVLAPFSGVISFFVTRTRLRNFPPFFLALSTFFPARNRAAEVLAPFSGVISFFWDENSSFGISRHFFWRYQLFPRREIAQPKFSLRFQALSVFVVTKTRASKFPAPFSGVISFFEMKTRALDFLAVFWGVITFFPAIKRAGKVLAPF
jgi:hypothetical protein